MRNVKWIYIQSNYPPPPSHSLSTFRFIQKGFVGLTFICNWTKLISQLGFNDNHSIKYHNKLCPPIAFHLSTSNFDIHSNRNISYFYGRSIKKFFTALTTNIHKTFGQRPAFLVVRSVQKPQRQCKYLIRKIKTSSVSVRSIGFRSFKLLLSKDVSFFVSLFFHLKTVVKRVVAICTRRMELEMELTKIL